MSYHVFAFATLAYLLVLSQPCAAEDDLRPPTPATINQAIDKGRAWLKQKQDEDGSWGPCVAYESYDGAAPGRSECFRIGPTAFAIFTLAKCGVPAKDPVLKQGIEWLKSKAGRRKEYRYTSYESAAVVLMLAALHDPTRESKKGRLAKPSKNPLRPPRGSSFPHDDWKWMHERLEHLVHDRFGCQVEGGGWGYWNTDRQYWDVSATQFSLLALRDATRAGFPVNRVAPETWKRALQGLRKFQLPSGAFPYHAGEPWSAGMTAAGVGSLLICKEQLQLAGEALPDWLEPAVAKGLAFTGRTFDVTRNSGEAKGRTPTIGHYHYCHLYAIERVGALSGLREVGGKAWYPRGAAFLLGKQRSDGSWVDTTCMFPQDVLGTCFALLFLKKATPTAVTAGPDDR